MTEVLTSRLVKVSADGVLGEYNHRFEFNPGSDFVIIFGPNGTGKTKLLEIVNAMYAMNISKLTSLPFHSVTLTFEDGAKLSAEKTALPEEEVPSPRVRKPGSKRGPQWEIIVTLTVPGSKRPLVWRANPRLDFDVWLQTETPWEPSSIEGVWRDSSDHELVPYDELRRQYTGRFRFERDHSPAKGKEMHPQIRSFVDSLSVKLIETQRLLATEMQAREDRYRGERSQQVPSIVQFSRQIQRLLDENLTANSRLTQQLDSTFPRRMLDRGAISVLDEDALREKWENQTQKRARLTEIADLGVLDSELSLPEGTLNEWQLSMLDLYLADADRKLDSFEHVLQRIDLLERVVNGRLLRKSMRINAKSGIVMRRHSDDSIIDLVTLSSGEQHEIILLFDLLFNVTPGSVVMIDEPEISLHIGWQVKFIQDVLTIAELVGFQFIVATHSPQIIDRWWSDAARMGPETAEF